MFQKFGGGENGKQRFLNDIHPPHSQIESIYQQVVLISVKSSKYSETIFFAK